ncbi:MAG: amino acid ABC transporter permease [Alphaproteobacteria bacterium]|nr:amino acid ABC transporter permease [Alphaproteobacteria bacterium]
MKHIPGVTTRPSTDLPVLLPLNHARARAPEAMMVSRWLAGLPAWTPLALMALILLWPLTAQAAYTYGQSIDALWRWMPFLLKSGFLFNVIISFLAMAVGTIAGAALGLAQISHVAAVRRTAWFVTQLFRNSPWLVLLFIVMLALPFEIVIGDTIIAIPDWTKAVFGLSLPIMANISEIVRGAVQSVPSAQWEASEALAFNRRQILWMIILPQCIKRMIPPWMNWYAILTMATPLCSLLAVEEIVTLSRQAIESENNHPELLVPFYSFIMLVFFAYCYPIARLTVRLERKFAVKF